MSVEDRSRMGRLAKAGQEDETWLLVSLNKQTFALPGRRVRELVMGADIMPVAGSPEYVRGVINLRGRVISVVDLRRRLGMRSAPEEVEAFCQMMEQRLPVAHKGGFVVRFAQKGPNELPVLLIDTERVAVVAA